MRISMKKGDFIRLTKANHRLNTEKSGNFSENGREIENRRKQKKWTESLC